jgi:hypothetical protein
VDSELLANFFGGKNNRGHKNGQKKYCPGIERQYNEVREGEGREERERGGRERRDEEG